MTDAEFEEGRQVLPNEILYAEMHNGICIKEGFVLGFALPIYCHVGDQIVWRFGSTDDRAWRAAVLIHAGTELIVEHEMGLLARVL